MRVGVVVCPTGCWLDIIYILELVGEHVSEGIDALMW